MQKQDGEATNTKPQMTIDSKNTILVDGERIDLRNRPLAALLAWLIPGAGHLYQGRYTKGVLFMVCILSAWVLGFALGGGHVVYASWAPGDKRWHYFLQGSSRPRHHGWGSPRGGELGRWMR